MSSWSGTGWTSTRYTVTCRSWACSSRSSADIEGAAPGAVPAALGEAGKKPGDIKVLAVDAQDSTLKAIEDGWITTTLNQCWFDTSVNIAKLIIEMKTSGKKAESFYPVAVDPISKENLPYEGCSEKTANDPFGY